MNSVLKKLLILFLAVMPFTGCTNPVPIQGPEQEGSFFATGFVREHGFWLCGNYGLMLEHCDCAECPEFANDLVPLNWDFETLDFKGKYVGVEGFWFEDTLGLCPMIVVESLKEIPVRYRCGDIDHNWIIDSVDAKAIIYYVNTVPPSWFDIDLADVNCDGTVNISDAVYLINYIYVPGSKPPCDTDRDGIPDC